jgi:hypothetical protein
MAEINIIVSAEVIAKSAFTDAQWADIHAMDLPALKFMLAMQMHLIKQLKGEAGVYCDLLRECLSVMDTIDGEDLDECDRLGDLTEKICKVIGVQ